MRNVILIITGHIFLTGCGVEDTPSTASSSPAAVKCVEFENTSQSKPNLMSSKSQCGELKSLILKENHDLPKSQLALIE